MSTAPYDPNEMLKELGVDLPPIDTPHEIARRIVAEEFPHELGSTLKHWAEDFYRWGDAGYRALPTPEFTDTIGRWVNDYFEQDYQAKLLEYTNRDESSDEGKKLRPPKKLPVKQSLTRDVRQALAGMDGVQLTLEACPAPPAWVGEPHRWAAADVLPFRNSLVHLPSLVAGRVESIPPTPALFNTSTMAYDFDPDAPQPVRWLAFLRQVLRDDASIACLQEWLGYCLGAATDRQKMMLIQGPPRSGKGTISRVMTQLFAPGNVVNPDFENLSQHFELQCLVGKKVAIVTDAKTGKKIDIATMIGRLLAISGEDDITVARKHRDDLTLRIHCRFTIMLNTVPAMRDASRAFANRFVVVTTKESFLGKEDLTLEARLLGELPGILNWAVAGLARLQQAGRFTEAESAAHVRADLEASSSPLTGFIHARAELKEGDHVRVDEFYHAYLVWCREEGVEPLARGPFGKALSDFYEGKVEKKARRAGVDNALVNVYQGIRLLPREDAPDYGPCWPALRSYLRRGPAHYRDIVRDLEDEFSKEDVDRCFERARENIEVTMKDGVVFWDLVGLDYSPTIAFPAGDTPLMGAGDQLVDPMLTPGAFP